MKNNKKLTCLIIHGFGGGTYEIKPLDDYLSDKGYITSCPKLKGHTVIGKDMKSASYKDWIASAEEELVILMKKTDNIAIIGFSMGGLIAANLASKYDIKAIVTINTPIYCWNLKRVFLNIWGDIKNKNLHNTKRYIKAKKASPIVSMINFLLLLNSTKPKLPDIKCPFLVLQTKDDDTVRLKSSYYIYENIKSKDKTLKLYDQGGHLVLIGQNNGDVFRDIEEFLNFRNYQ